MTCDRFNDRYLMLRGRKYQYVRRIPSEVQSLDHRNLYVRISLHTSDLGLARQMRDLYERADNEYWASLVRGEQPQAAWRRYTSTTKQLRALRFSHLPQKNATNDQSSHRLTWGDVLVAAIGVSMAVGPSKEVNKKTLAQDVEAVAQLLSKAVYAQRLHDVTG